MRDGSVRLARSGLFGPALVLVLTLGAAGAGAQETVRVTSPGAPVYLQPDSASTIIVTLATGAVVDVQRKAGEWYAVLLPPDPQGLRRYGFIAATAVEVLRNREEPAVAFSQIDRGKWAIEGVYLGVSMTFQTFRGGPELLRETQSSDVLFFPTVNSHSGFAIAFGQNFERTAFELTYARSAHEAPAQLVAGPFGVALFEVEAVYQRIDVDYKRYIVVRRWRPQPYLRAGFGYPVLKVKRGAIVGGTIQDVTLSGMGLQLGTGLTFIAHSRIAAQVAATYRADLFFMARGGSGDWGEVLGTLSLRGWNVTTGMSYMF